MVIEASGDQSHFTTQDWAAYTPEEHDVWSVLYDRRMAELRETGSRLFLDKADAIGLRRDRVPDLNEVNQMLGDLTGWKAVAVKGFLPAKDFFRCIAERRFPTTVTVRPREQLEYLEEPDIFHDVFGHVPLHADQGFADFLQQFGQIAARVTDEEDIRRMARLFWFTIEFGLVREDGEIKVYGSGLISSVADGANALGPKCDRRPFDLEAVLNQPFEIDHLQDVLFVIDSFDQLFEAVAELAARS